MAICKLTTAERKEIEGLQGAFEEARSDLAQRLEDIAADWDADVAEKSDSWHEKDAGKEAAERLEHLRGLVDELPGEGEPALDLGPIS